MREIVFGFVGETGDGVITLRSASDLEMHFKEIAGIGYKGQFYSVLRPLDEFTQIFDMPEDAAVVFRVTHNPDSDAMRFEVIVDEEIIGGVFAEYNRWIKTRDDSGE